jgi:uncharacterized repeat protein (TIGR01451 family)
MSNLGPGTATGVQVTDLLPAGVTFTSATPLTGTYDSATGVWMIGTVAPGDTPILFLRGKLATPNAVTNTATISHADQFDPNVANNSASVSATPQQADLAITKAVSNPTPAVGDSITFTLRLDNAGPSPATGVQVTDKLPVGLTFISATPSQGTYNASTGVWTAGSVAPGMSVQTLQIIVQATSESVLTNSAMITHADQFDPNNANDTASVTVTPL